MIQSKENDNLADGAGNAAVDRQIVVLECLDDFCRGSLGHFHQVKAQDTSHIPVTIRESDEFFYGECLDHGRVWNLMIDPVLFKSVMEIRRYCVRSH